MASSCSLLAGSLDAADPMTAFACSHSLRTEEVSTRHVVAGEAQHVVAADRDEAGHRSLRERCLDFGDGARKMRAHPVDDGHFLGRKGTTNRDAARGARRDGLVEARQRIQPHQHVVHGSIPVFRIRRNGQSRWPGSEAL